ncbi:flavonoid 3-O-glucosyltransferase-like isoform X2 [Prosopis cineraria]|uniref:flavonoid 3-O-glucosyltransferase-like isoform X2 n=1 Tax=Prosopis cineraria TaxID=364024 RepID=UPI0024106BC7|nr:flavonoid 3-O-glucosyltransferase-like isoform X2 [Prosopis cineraria]
MKAASETLHVAILAFPFGTHSVPLLNIVQRIAADSPKVTFSFFCTATNIADAHASIFLEFPNIKPYNVNDGVPADYVPSGHPLERVHLFLREMQKNYQQAMEQAVAEEGKKITCIVTDAFLWFGAEMAEQMRAKWIPVWMAGPHALLTHVVTDLLRQKFPCDDDVKVRDLPEGIVREIEEPFALMIHKAGQMLPKATAVAINSYDTILPPIVNDLESKFRMLLHIGPLALTTLQPAIPDKHGCLQWLDMHKTASVLYIGFGSVILPPPHELSALAQALEEGRFPFIWSFRGNPEKQLPEGFLERTEKQGIVVPWAPQVDILKHSSTGVFMTHCGWNSILESIAGGVPMICRPFFGDQRLNTLMLEREWGVAMAVENGVITKDEIIRVLESSLSGEKGKTMRSNIGSLKQSAMKAVEPCGSSTLNFSTLIELVTT